MRFLIPLVLLSSCTLYHENDIKQTRTLAQVGGNVAWRKNVGLVAKNEKSFDRAMSAGESIAASGFAYKAYKANQAAQSVASVEATKQNVTNKAAEVEKAVNASKQAVTEKALDSGAEIGTVTVTPP